MARRNEVRPSTLAGYRVVVDQTHRPRTWPQAPQRPYEGEAFYAGLLENGRKRDRGALSAKTVKNIHVVIRKALQDALEGDYVDRNVAAVTRPPKVSSSKLEMMTWTKDKLREFLERIEFHRLNAFFRFTATSGVRRGEVLGLRWEDVDFETARIAIRQTIVLVDNKALFSEPKTKRSRRSIPLDIETLAALRAWRAQQAKERLAFGPGYVETGLVFTKEDGSGIHPDWISKQFERLTREAGLPEIRFHDLRHTFATLASRQGCTQRSSLIALGTQPYPSHSMCTRTPSRQWMRRLQRRSPD